MRAAITTGIVAALLLLPACTLLEVKYGEPEQPEGTGEEEPDAIRETTNVTYSGVLEPAGISIYQQGSHRLTLTGGRFILLESEKIDLNGYVGEEVQIFGALRPTVEAGGMIMRVERIELLTAEASEAEETSEAAATSANGESSSESSESSVSSESSESSAIPSSETTEAADASAAAKVAVMASENFSASNWTQNYCSGHIGFCAPVHRNWWFHSFGATTTALWHVEMSSEPLENLSDGPIAINLLTGTVTSEDGSVETVGGTAKGIRAWTDNRHFEITADASLEQAVAYITQGIVEYTEEE